VKLVDKKWAEVGGTHIQSHPIRLLKGRQAKAKQLVKLV